MIAELDLEFSVCVEALPVRPMLAPPERARKVTSYEPPQPHSRLTLIDGDTLREAWTQDFSVQDGQPMLFALDIDGDGHDDFAMGSRIWGQITFVSGETGRKLWSWDYYDCCSILTQAVGPAQVVTYALGFDEVWGSHVGYTLTWRDGATGAALHESDQSLPVRWYYQAFTEADLRDINHDGSMDLTYQLRWEDDSGEHSAASLISGADGAKLADVPSGAWRLFAASDARPLADGEVAYYTAELWWASFEARDGRGELVWRASPDLGPSWQVTQLLHPARLIPDATGDGHEEILFSLQEDSHTLERLYDGQTGHVLWSIEEGAS